MSDIEPPSDSRATYLAEYRSGWHLDADDDTDTGPIDPLSFTFPAPGKRLSANDRMHWARRAGITSMWRQAGHIYAKRTLTAHRPWSPYPADVKVTFEVKDPTRRRDPMNAYPTVKALVDGCVDAGVWPDDDAKWVTIIQPEFVKGVDRVRIDITPRGAA